MEKTVDVRVQVNQENNVAVIYENTLECKSANLRLENDGMREGMPMVCVAFGTGITPFLSYIRYMKAHEFGVKTSQHGNHLTLIVSVRHEAQWRLNGCFRPMES